MSISSVGMLYQISKTSDGHTVPLSMENLRQQNQNGCQSRKASKLVMWSHPDLVGSVLTVGLIYDLEKGLYNAEMSDVIYGHQPVLTRRVIKGLQYLGYRYCNNC